MANQKVATEFEKIIHNARERKKNQALAERIFGTKNGRRASLPTPKSGSGPSLASRVGVKKRVVSQTSRAGGAAAIPTGPSNGAGGIPRGPRGARVASAPGGPLAARVGGQQPARAAGFPPASAPTAPAANRPQTRAVRRQEVRAAKLGAALAGPAGGVALQQANVINAPRGPGGAAATTTGGGTIGGGGGFAIKGLAGPYTLMAQNFAPGTTAADIESALTPVGGYISSCRLVKTHPLIIAEITFESREGAEKVLQTFNNQTADGRVLHVYAKTTAPSGPAAVPAAYAAPRASLGSAGVNANANANATVIDGSLGFDDPMDTDAGRLYSDSLVTNGGANGSAGSYRGRGGGGGAGGGRGYAGGRGAAR